MGSFFNKAGGKPNFCYIESTNYKNLISAILNDDLVLHPVHEAL